MNFYLKGEFNFFANSICMENIRSSSTEEVSFNLMKEQIFFVKNIIGNFVFVNPSENLRIKFF